MVDVAFTHSRQVVVGRVRPQGKCRRVGKCRDQLRDVECEMKFAVGEVVEDHVKTVIFNLRHAGRMGMCMGMGIGVYMCVW